MVLLSSLSALSALRSDHNNSANLSIRGIDFSLLWKPVQADPVL